MKKPPTKKRKPYKYTKKTGRPAKYSEPEKMAAKIEKYFNGGAYKRKHVTQFGVTILIPTPTISDLVLYLGFVDRQSFYDYGNKPEFSGIIKKARTMIEREYENKLHSQTCTGAIFALKNFGWIDKPQEEKETNGDSTVINIIGSFNGKAKKGLTESERRKATECLEVLSQSSHSR